MIPADTIAADVAKLSARRPWAIVARSSWPPHELVVVARVENDWVARNVALDYVAAGFLDVHAENERATDVWYPPTAVTA